MRKNYLTIGVTGAAGFIGSSLCKDLVSKNYNVIGVDNLDKGIKENLKEITNRRNFTFIKTDVRDLKKLSKNFKAVNVIIHLAAAKIPRYGGRLKTLRANTEGTINVLEVARRNKARVIFASTSDVYGKNNMLPFKEDSNLVLGSTEVARWAYAASKIFDEHLCFAYNEEYGIDFVILRIFGVFGPGHHRSWWSGPPSLFIDAILSGKTVEIHGSGKQTRCLMYISDALDAFEKVILTKKATGEILNIGSQEEMSIMDLAKLISSLLKKPLKIKKVHYSSFTGKKYEDVIRRVPDIYKAKKILGWEPKVSLRKGLQLTAEWHIQNPV